MCNPDDARLMRDLWDRKTAQAAAMQGVIHADDALIAAVCDPHTLDLGPLMADCELARVRLAGMVAQHTIEGG